MGSPNDLNLRIVIETILKGQGVQASGAEVEKLTKKIEAAAVAGKQLQVSTDDIVKGLEAQRAAAKSAGSSWEELSEAQKAVQREAAQTALAQIEAAEAAKKAAGAASNLGRDLGTAKQAGAGLAQVFRGVLAGDINQVSQGFLGISKAAATASPAMQSLFGQVARGAAIGSSFAAPILVGLVALKAKAKELEDQIKKIYSEAAKANENYTKNVEALAERRKKAVESELKTIGELAAAYENQKAGTAGSRARITRLDNAKEDLRKSRNKGAEEAALRRARSPEERKKIQEEIERLHEADDVYGKLNGFQQADTAANFDIDQAHGTLSKARQENAGIDARIAEAKREFEDAVQRAKIFLPGHSTGSIDPYTGLPTTLDNVSPQALDARKKAIAAKDNLEALKKELNPAYADNAKLIEAAQAQIDAARLDKEETALRRQAYQALVDARRAELAAAKTPAARATIKEIDAAVDAATNDARPTPAGPILGEITTSGGKTIVAKRTHATKGGTITRGGETIVVDSANTVAQIRAAQEAFDLTAKAIESFSGFVIERANKAEKKVTALKESSAGS